MHYVIIWMVGMLIPGYNQIYTGPIPILTRDLKICYIGQYFISRKIKLNKTQNRFTETA